MASGCKLVVKDSIKKGSMGRYGKIVKEFKFTSNKFDHCNAVHDLAKFVIANGVGRYIWLGTPYSMHILINIVINQ
jgi:hypothetical protein